MVEVSLSNKQIAHMYKSLTRHALFRNLSVIDLLLQGEVANEAVDVARFSLPIAVHPTHSLGIMTWVPRSIEQDDTVGSDQIHAQAARSERNIENI